MSRERGLRQSRCFERGEMSSRSLIVFAQPFWTLTQVCVWKRFWRWDLLKTLAQLNF